MQVTLLTIKENHLVNDYLKMGNNYIGNIGALEHNIQHAEYTSDLCSAILAQLGCTERETELGAIAGYLHDIGNIVNRYGHGMSGALIAFDILMDLGMDPHEMATIIGAIGNHEEHAQGQPVNNVAAALILADKSDVHRSRVRKNDFSAFTSRDRVNYAVTSSGVEVEPEARKIIMRLEIDTQVTSVMEYFEIFLTKMLMCRHAAEHLKCEFILYINDTRLL